MSVQHSENLNPKVETVLSEQPRQLSQDELKALDEDLPKKARQILEEADEFELMSVGSNSMGQKQIHEDAVISARFGRIPILGRTKITDAEVKRKLINALYEGIVNPRPVSACFYPRHIIRAASKGKKVELVICFQCHNFMGNSPEGDLYGQISDTPQELFNQVLTSAGVPLSKF
jgi:hypothetical protein